MENAVFYTDTEQELLEVMEDIRKLLKKTITFNLKLWAIKQNSLQMMKQMAKDIHTFAKLRQEYADMLAKEKTDHWESFHDVECTKCKFFTSLRPTKEAVYNDGLTYHIYECPKCKTVFRDSLPNNIKDTMVFAKKQYDFFVKRDKRGRINYVTLGVPKEMVTSFSEMYTNLKVADDNVIAERIEKEASAKNFEAVIADELVRFKVFKAELLNGGPLAAEE